MKKIISVGAVVLAVSGFTLTSGAEAGKSGCGSSNDPCSQQVKTAYQAKLASLAGQPQMSVTPQNCRKVDIWSFKAMSLCRGVTETCKTAFKGQKMSGWCADACAECQRKRNFILVIEKGCLADGYKPIATRKRK